MHDGISVYNTEAQARSKARDFNLGEYIAVLEIPDDAPIDCQRMLTSRGHQTLRGDPSYLLGCVIAVVKV